jgi:vacuolar-type H+-ATPase subunit D/Vma8
MTVTPFSESSLSSQTVIHNVKGATYKVKLRSENVVGVHLPVFDSINDRSGQPSMPILFYDLLICVSC